MPERPRLGGNTAERLILEHLEREGWTVVKNGWPDFLATRGDEVRLIEVKPEGKPLSPRQKHVVDALAKLGVTVELGTIPVPRGKRRILGPRPSRA